MTQVTLISDEVKQLSPSYLPRSAIKEVQNCPEPTEENKTWQSVVIVRAEK